MLLSDRHLRTGAPQTPDAVVADVTPSEAAKYESHFERARGRGSWVELSRAREYFAKANLQVRPKP